MSNDSMAKLPKPIRDFIVSVADAYEYYEGGVGYSVNEARGPEDDWLIWTYILPLEMFGGVHDGEIVTPAYTVRLEDIRKLFDKRENIDSSYEDMATEDGPGVLLFGSVSGHSIVLKILVSPPDDVNPSQSINWKTGGISDKGEE